MDFEPLARKALPPAHWGYMATGVDDDKTLRANREAFDHYQLRARRLVDVTQGRSQDRGFRRGVGLSGLYQRGREPEGVPPGRRTRDSAGRQAKKTMQMLSTVTSSPVEEVGKALGTAALVSALHAHYLGRH